MNPEGAWNGVLDLGYARVRLGLDLTVGTAGPVARLHVPSRGLHAVPVEAAIGKDRLELRVALVGAVFVADLRENDLIAGEWRQSDGAFPLALHRGAVGTATRAARPQTPTEPKGYREEEVRVPAGEGLLAGALTLPDGQGPFPCLVLHPWAGPSDRDGSVSGHRPLRVLADRLASAGVASLRCDKRGVGGSSGNLLEAVTDDFAADLVASCAFVRGDPRLDPARIGVLGHSEGALVAALAARELAVPPAVCILLTPPALPGDQSLLGQMRATAAAGGNISETAIALEAQLFAAMKGKPRAAARAAAQAVLRAEVSAGRLDQPQADAKLAELSIPWRHAFLDVDPAEVYRGLTGPVLVVQAGRDRQTPPDLHGEALTAAFAGNGETTFLLGEGLNHLLQPAQTGLPSEYADIELTIAPDMLEAIAAWATANLPPRAAAPSKEVRDGARV